jgi:competence protein ComEA
VPSVADMQVSRSGQADAEAARRRLLQLGAELRREEQDRDTFVPAAPGRHAARAVPASSRIVGRLGDSVPPAIKGRWGISAQHVTVVAFVVATLLALGAWWVVQSRPQPVEELPITSAPSPAPSIPTTESSPGPGAPSDASASPASSVSSAGLVVHVAGKVRRPGIVTLPAGSRVIDALQAAGGAQPGVGLAGLNLARPLADGEQILVGLGVGAPSGVVGSPSGGPSAAGGLINVNTATSTELEELPGIGPVTAEAILQWRAEHGRFSTVDELLEVSGIGEVTLAEIREHVTV